MTARRALPLAAGVLLAAAWVYALTRLWPSSVPDGVRLPRVDAGRLVAPGVLDRAQRFSRVQQLLTLAQQLVVLGVVVLYARRGAAALMRESAAGPIGTGMLLGMLGLALVWLAALPLRVVDFWWVKHYGIVRTDWVSFVVGDYFQLGAQFAAASLELAIVMGLARVLRRAWPLVAVPLVVALQVGLVLLIPVLLTDTGSLDRPALRADAQRLARVEGVRDVHFHVERVHEETTAPNAEAIGLRRDGGHVILWDTLFRHGFRHRELEVVVAHELAHLRHRDTLRLVGFTALLLVPLALLAQWFTRGLGGLARPEAVPAALLVVVAFGLVTQPLTAAFSRSVEAAADWTALDATRDPAAARTLFTRFAPTALAEPRSPGWAHVLYADHPELADRVAMAEAWAARSAR